MTLTQRILLGILILLIGCTTVPQRMADKMNFLRLNMTREEAIQILGTPVSTAAKRSTEYLNYEFFVTQDDLYRRYTTKYFVRLVDGRVDSYGRLGDFDSTSTRTTPQVVTRPNNSEKRVTKLGDRKLISVRLWPVGGVSRATLKSYIKSGYSKSNSSEPRLSSLVSDCLKRELLSTDDIVLNHPDGVPPTLQLFETLFGVRKPYPDFGIVVNIKELEEVYSARSTRYIASCVVVSPNPSDVPEMIWGYVESFVASGSSVEGLCISIMASFEVHILMNYRANINKTK